MMGFVYLSAILFSTFGMATLDHKFKLAFFHDRFRAALTIATGVLIFILWDIAGIALGIFSAGASQYMTGFFLAPDFPIEELFFLTFLCYFTLILYRILETRWQRT